MVTIRLSRGGTTKRPFYHIVATDHRNRRDGRYLERLGFFNPIAAGRDTALQIDLARVEYWQGQGAQLSARVAALLDDYRAVQQAATGAAAA
jgi:small subunit ribosomal protein S16